MSLSMSELARARDTTGKLLNELGLDAYLFEIEPRDEQWELKIDCALETDGAWRSVTFLVPKDMLLRSLDDPMLRQRILTDMRHWLNTCKVQKP